MEPQPTNTPGLGGYLLAWLVSVVLCAIALQVVVGWSGSGEVVVWEDFVTLLTLTSAFSVLVAPWGLMAVHLICHERPGQLEHVLVAGAAGLALTLLLGALLPFLVFFAPFVALAAAVGRAAVIPLVWHRRRNSAGSLVRC